MGILAEFDNDIRYMISFAWGQNAANLYPTSPVAKMVKTEKSPLDDVPSGTAKAEVIQGLSKLDKCGQAAQIRSCIKKRVPQYAFDTLEAKLAVPVDHESEQSKFAAIRRLAESVQEAKGYHGFYTAMVCLQWSGEHVPLSELRQASGKGERQEREDRNTIKEMLNILFDDAVDIAENALT